MSHTEAHLRRLRARSAVKAASPVLRRDQGEYDASLNPPYSLPARSVEYQSAYDIGSTVPPSTFARIFQL